MDEARLRVGFIGFGEVARAFSPRMREKGGEIVAYDKFPDRVSAKAEALGVSLVESLEELISSCTLILSTLWPGAAYEAASEAAPFLCSGKIYCDLNSISPQTTAKIDLAISASGADFVKVGIMAAIPDRGFAVPLVAGGAKADETAQMLSALGLNVHVMGTDPKQPAALKILRSVCLKGIVALTYEMLRGAEKYGIVEEILDSASEALSKASFKDTVSRWLASMAIHAGRRAGEMEEAMEVLEAEGIRPVMSEATRDIFKEIADLELDKSLDGKIPDSFYPLLKR